MDAVLTPTLGQLSRSFKEASNADKKRNSECVNAWDKTFIACGSVVLKALRY
jgi:hypothetical protein